ncbi:MAG: hypothetical protein ACRDQW_13870, partial [Haloechinothrix sp.]
MTFISVASDASTVLPWRATTAIADADIVIWADGTPRDDVLRNANGRADVIDSGRWTTHALLPFYDLASREGFRIAQIRSEIPARWDDVFEQMDRCCELGVATEIVRCGPPGSRPA